MKIGIECPDPLATLRHVCVCACVRVRVRVRVRVGGKGEVRVCSQVAHGVGRRTRARLQEV